VVGGGLLPAVEPERLGLVLDDDGVGGLSSGLVGRGSHESRVDTVGLGLAWLSKGRLRDGVVLGNERERNLVTSYNAADLSGIENESTSADFDIVDNSVGTKGQEGGDGCEAEEHCRYTSEGESGLGWSE